MSIKKTLPIVFILLIIVGSFFAYNVYSKNLEEQKVLEEQKIAEEKAAQEALAAQQAREAEEARIQDIKNRLKVGDTSNMKVVFLTFDDGPNENSNEVLDILASNNVKATFFTNGRTGPENEAVYKRIVNEGHTLANHTYSHDYSIYNSTDTFLADVKQQEDYLRQVTGIEPAKVFRFPGGSNTTNTNNINALVSSGYSYYDWTASAGDGSSIALSPEQTLSKILTEVYEKPNAAVILMHAENPAKSQTRACLDQLIKQLQSEGYTFMTLEPGYQIAQFM